MSDRRIGSAPGLETAMGGLGLLICELEIRAHRDEKPHPSKPEVPHHARAYPRRLRMIQGWLRTYGSHRARLRVRDLADGLGSHARHETARVQIAARRR